MNFSAIFVLYWHSSIEEIIGPFTSVEGSFEHRPELKDSDEA